MKNQALVPERKATVTLTIGPKWEKWIDAYMAMMNKRPGVLVTSRTSALACMAQVGAQDLAKVYKMEAPPVSLYD